MRKALATCSCGEQLLKSDGEGGLIIRGKILVIKKGMGITKCPQCRKDVELPLDMKVTVLEPKLYIDPAKK